MSRGGKREGAGRKKSADPTVTIRVPQSKVILVKEWVKGKHSVPYQSDESMSKIADSISLLNHALKLKANAGGKIKTEIRKVINILQS